MTINTSVTTTPQNRLTFFENILERCNSGKSSQNIGKIKFYI